ncbi:cysteine-rich receptor-like protein kinase 46 isoform X2 [Primulina huaijiensis]|uniref:cysteine-rich receptor-like protein kinase 46 isoform X2 n=1 Tax=Primulina huaijiensis TaxID=1492673 RepID=UPI003CC70E06
MFLTENTQNQEISNEIDIIGQAHHPTLVRFLGYCFTYTNGYLVYEYLPNKSLDLILFGTAEGLQYMHEDCHVQIMHRDIKRIHGSRIPLRRRLTEKVDVYSNGVLVLEIGTWTIIMKAWKHYQMDKVASVTDPMLGIEDSSDVQRIVEIALLCNQESHDLRPTMARVVEFLTKKDLISPAPSRPSFV